MTCLSSPQQKKILLTREEMEALTSLGCLFCICDTSARKRVEEHNQESDNLGLWRDGPVSRSNLTFTALIELTMACKTQSGIVRAFARNGKMSQRGRRMEKYRRHFTGFLWSCRL